MICSHENRVGDVRGHRRSASSRPTAATACAQHAAQFRAGGHPVHLRPGPGHAAVHRPRADRDDRRRGSTWRSTTTRRSCWPSAPGLPLTAIARARRRARSSRWAATARASTPAARRSTSPPCRPRELVDPTGCGDAYRAGLLYGMAQGWDWQKTGGSHRCSARSRSARAAARTTSSTATRRIAVREALPSRISGKTERPDRTARRMTRLALVPRTLARNARHAARRARALRRRSPCSRSSTLPRKRTLIKRWSARLLALLNIEARVQGALDARRRQRPDRREPRLVARHLRAQRAAPGALRRQIRARALAVRRAPDPRRGHDLHRARAAPRHQALATPVGSIVARLRDEPEARWVRQPFSWRRAVGGGVLIALSLFVSLIFWQVIFVTEHDNWPPPADAITADGAQAATEQFVSGSPRPRDLDLDYAWTTAATVEPWAEGAEFYPRIVDDIRERHRVGPHPDVRLGLGRDRHRARRRS